jgi:hypothetical protein
MPEKDDVVSSFKAPHTSSQMGGARGPWGLFVPDGRGEGVWGDCVSRARGLRGEGPTSFAQLVEAASRSY